MMEFFEGENGQLSMTRLLCFLSFFPASYVVVVNTSESILGWYLGAYVLSYIGGKGADVLMKPKMPSEPPNVTINQPDKVNVAS